MWHGRQRGIDQIYFIFSLFEESYSTPIFQECNIQRRRETFRRDDTGWLHCSPIKQGTMTHYFFIYLLIAQFPKYLCKRTYHMIKVKDCLEMWKVCYIFFMLERTRKCFLFSPYREVMPWRIVRFTDFKNMLCQLSEFLMNCCMKGFKQSGDLYSLKES